MENYIGTIAAFAFNKVPDGWLRCDGQGYESATYQVLAIMLNYRYGGSLESGRFNVPDLSGKIYLGVNNFNDIDDQGGYAFNALQSPQLPAHNHSFSAQIMTDGSGNTGTTVNPSGTYLSSSAGNIYTEMTKADSFLAVGMSATQTVATDYTGNGQAFSIAMPSIALNYCICAKGISPFTNVGMTPFAGMVVPFGFYYDNTFACMGDYLPCVGQLLNIKDYTLLYSIIGTTYGGNGSSTFALPNLNNATPIGAGTGPGLQNYPMCSSGGNTASPITLANLPNHTHTFASLGLLVSSGTGNTSNPKNAYLASSTPPKTGPIYSTTLTQPTPYPSVKAALGPAGNTDPLPQIDVTNPYIKAPYMIAINGLFPMRQ